MTVPLIATQSEFLSSWRACQRPCLGPRPQSDPASWPGRDSVLSQRQTPGSRGFAGTLSAFPAEEVYPPAAQRMQQLRGDLGFRVRCPGDFPWQASLGSLQAL